MKKVSAATKGRVLVIGGLPPFSFVLVGMLCMILDIATKINAAWLMPVCLCIGLTWFVVGFSVGTVLEFWPQDD